MKTLKEFYQAYSAWLDAGAPQGQPFVRGAGLCHNLCKFGGDRDAYIEMIRQFEAAGFDRKYPFDYRVENYRSQSDDETMHLNPLRIKWVKDHAQ